MPFLRSFTPLKWYGVCVCVFVCVSELSVPLYTNSSSFPRRRTTACARRVAEGWPRGRVGVMEGWHVEAGMERGTVEG